MTQTFDKRELKKTRPDISLAFAVLELFFIACLAVAVNPISPSWAQESQAIPAEETAPVAEEVAPPTAEPPHIDEAPIGVQGDSSSQAIIEDIKDIEPGRNELPTTSEES